MLKSNFSFSIQIHFRAAPYGWSLLNANAVGPFAGSLFIVRSRTLDVVSLIEYFSHCAAVRTRYPDVRILLPSYARISPSLVGCLLPLIHSLKMTITYQMQYFDVSRGLACIIHLNIKTCSKKFSCILFSVLMFFYRFFGFSLTSREAMCVSPSNRTQPLLSWQHAHLLFLFLLSFEASESDLFAEELADPSGFDVSNRTFDLSAWADPLH